MNNDRLTELLSRKLSGEATAAEVQELQLWLQANPGDQYFAEILQTYWHHRADQYFPDHTADQHFAHILEMASGEEEVIAATEPRRGILRRLGRPAAAAAVIIAVAGAVWSMYPQKKSTSVAEVKKNEVVAGRGIRSKMVLPDGTQVSLNSDSRLQYSGDFSGATREVTLEGEAYFDVVKNPQRPFIVHTSAIDIRVLGTSFNVKSYPKDNTVEATLIHGMIEVTDKNKPQAPKIILKPKEKLVFNKAPNRPIDSTRQKASVVNAQNLATAISIVALPHNVADTSFIETSWVYNRLIFEAETFSEVATKMERWYNIRINFRNKKLADYRLSGSFDSESIGEALQALRYIAPFNYKINNNEVEITD
ncbi:MAG: hypothetical protein DI535_22325 [Citrobacter freundii]|nr:MAG: hypothetical protein DI535_22325 [Citrobacter freundii]